MKNARLLLITLAGLMLLAACESYRSGATRTVGELTDDTAIQIRIKSRLTFAEDVNGLRMNVEVKKGVVSLYGRVDSEAMRRRAIEIVESVKGVVAVEDRLRVRPKKEAEAGSQQNATAAQPGT